MNMHGSMRDLAQGEHLDALIATTPALLVQFGSESCAPCSALRRRCDLWLERHPEVAGLYVDVEAHQRAAAQFGILSVPAIVVFFEGKRYVERCGYFSLDEALDTTRRHLEDFLAMRQNERVK